MKAISPTFSAHQLKALCSLLRKHGMALAYLYGSHARGTTHPASDVDLAIVPRQKTSGGRKLQKRLTLALPCAKVLATSRIDMVFFEDLPLAVQFEVLKDGRVLFCDDEDRRIGLEHRTMSHYFDRQYYFNRHSQLVLDQIAAGGILS